MKLCSFARPVASSQDVIRHEHTMILIIINLPCFTGFDRLSAASSVRSDRRQVCGEQSLVLQRFFKFLPENCLKYETAIKIKLFFTNCSNY